MDSDFCCSDQIQILARVFPFFLTSIFFRGCKSVEKMLRIKSRLFSQHIKCVCFLLLFILERCSLASPTTRPTTLSLDTLSDCAVDRPLSREISLLTFIARRKSFKFFWESFCAFCERASWDRERQFLNCCVKYLRNVA